jgi:hypothetical protein
MMERIEQMMSNQTQMNEANIIAAHALQIHEIDFLGWLGQAQPGDSIEYHRGFLALDTIRDGSRFAEKERLELSRVARRAWWASEQNLVHLAQRRWAKDDYSYLAIARPRTASTPLTTQQLMIEETI